MKEEDDVAGIKTEGR